MLRRIARLLLGTFSPGGPLRAIGDSETADSSSTEAVQEVLTPQQIMEMASARDYECSICMTLMIEPVLLPCNHELCYKCFMLNYTNTNDQCPFCRVRIATWARKAMRTKRVINTAKWDLIQKLFPERIKCITEGRDIISDEEEAEMQIIAEDGSLGKEYMAELEKIESERLKASQEEEAASLAMIEKLCQAEGQPFILPPVKMDSTSSSDVLAAAAAAGMPTDRMYSITDEDRLKQIKEEEEASLRLIKQLQAEEERLMKERQKSEDLDRHYARVISAALNKPPPKEPVVDPNDCVICPSPPCASLKSVLPVDASSSASSATASSAASSGSSIIASSSATAAGVLPTTPSTSSCAEFPGSVTTEATDKVVTPNSSIYRKCETNGKGKKSATKTGLTKWLKMSLPEAAAGSNSESGMDVLNLQPASTSVIDPVGTVPPTQTNTSGDSAAESSCTVGGPNVTGDASQRDRISDAFAAFVQSDVANNEHPEQRSSAVSKAIAPNVFASDPVFGFDLLEVLYQRNELNAELTRESDSTGIRSDAALTYPGQSNEIPASDNAMECSFSQNSDLLPAASGSRIRGKKQRGVKRGGVAGDATGTSGNTPACDTPSRISVASARGRKSSRGRSSAAGSAPARKSLKRSIVYINDDPEPCCSTSSVVSPNSSGSAGKKMCLNASDASVSNPQISEVSNTFADIPAVAKSDFDSEESYRLYLEEQDYQMALSLQRMFDLESRPAIVPQSAEPGGYNLRCRAKPSTNSEDEF